LCEYGSTPSGQIAMKLTEEEDMDLIITDIMMPEVDGIALCKKIKEQMETSHIPIVMLTAKTGVDSRIEGL
jgi:DNA-binding response OmpR family regulator